MKHKCRIIELKIFNGSKKYFVEIYDKPNRYPLDGQGYSIYNERGGKIKYFSSLVEALNFVKFLQGETEIIHEVN